MSSQLPSRSYSLLPPPCQPSQGPPSSSSSSRRLPSSVPASSSTSTNRSKRPPRPVGEPRPPTSSKPRSSLLQPTQLCATSTTTTEQDRSTSSSSVLDLTGSQDSSQGSTSASYARSQEQSDGDKANRPGNTKVSSSQQSRSQESFSSRSTSSSSRPPSSTVSASRQASHPTQRSNRTATTSSKSVSTPDVSTFLEPSPRANRRPRSPIAMDYNGPPPPPVPTEILSKLTSTNWSSLDPTNAYLFSSSRLFQISHLTDGPLTSQQLGRKRDREEEKRWGKVQYGKTRESKEELERLEKWVERKKGKERGGKDERSEEGESWDDPPSWAKTIDGTEWEEGLLEKLAKRLAKIPSISQHIATSTNDSLSTRRPGLTAATKEELRPGVGEDLIPICWISDIERMKKVRLGGMKSLECYLLGRGKEFPCKRVIVVGWIRGREYSEREGSWIYTIDDGTALIEVMCSFHPPFPSSPTRLGRPIFSPPAFIPPPLSYNVKSPAPSDSKPPPPPPSREPLPFGVLDQRALSSVSSDLILSPGSLVRVLGTIQEPRFKWNPSRKIVADRIETLTSPSSSTSTGYGISIQGIRKESQHHLMVERLHRQVYDLDRFDLKKVLERMDREEREVKRQLRSVSGGSTMSSDNGGGSEFGDGSSSFLSSSAGSSAAGSPSRGAKRYRPTRPSKLLPEDLTLLNFIVYIRHHVLKNYVTQTSSLPPPSNQSISNDDLFREGEEGEEERILESCEPFTISKLRSNRHLEEFAQRMSLERLRVEKEKERKVREKKRREGEFGVLVSQSSSSSSSSGGKVWVMQGDREDEDGKRMGALKGARKKVEVGSARLIQMLPPPTSGSSNRSQSNSSFNVSSTSASSRLVGKPSRSQRRRRPGDSDDDSEDEEEIELKGKHLEREVKRCWEEVIRNMVRHGHIVEYIPPLPPQSVDSNKSEDDQDVDEEEDEEDQVMIHRHQGSHWNDVLPDEPRTTNQSRSTSECPWGDIKLPDADSVEEDERDQASTPKRSRSRLQQGHTPLRKKQKKIATERLNDDTTPRASNRSQPPTLPLVEHSFQLVTPLSLTEIVYDHLSRLSESNEREQRIAKRSRGGSSTTTNVVVRNNVTEKQIRESMSMDDQWVGVARFSEVVTKTLEVLERWNEIVQSGKGWQIA